ncbi:hypothetical protein SSX86_005815 [Deinandra increscens subsp. villosa]|uniref:DJ-1/PfpI domain-containing protein n=1 Tax=Deinandra increscens subsp. villosa TaxID=3103831 RepID=A0AAP0DQQ9_9ASTR
MGTEELPRKVVLVPIASGTEAMEAVMVVDVLRRAGADVTIASVEQQPCVVTLHGIKIVADMLISECVNTSYDLISIPGGVQGSIHLRDNHTLSSIVCEHTSAGRIYGATGAASALVLRDWGLLCGREATCYPSFMDRLSSSRHVELVTSRVHICEGIITGQGTGTTLDYAVTLVEQLFGKKSATDVSQQLMMRSYQKANFIDKEYNKKAWSSNCGAKVSVLVPIADGSEEMETVIIIDVLRRAKVEVVVASVSDKLEILASRKVKIVADMLLSDAAKYSYDLIVLPGGFGGAKAFAASRLLVNLLKKQSKEEKCYGATCDSPALVLQLLGLLKDKKATAFPEQCEKLLDRSAAKGRVVIDGKVITSRGFGTTLEFALGIVEKFLGHEKAMEIAKTIVFI